MKKNIKIYCLLSFMMIGAVERKEDFMNRIKGGINRLADKASEAKGFIGRTYDRAKKNVTNKYKNWKEEKAEKQEMLGTKRLVKSLVGGISRLEVAENSAFYEKVVNPFFNEFEIKTNGNALAEWREIGRIVPPLALDQYRLHLIHFIFLQLDRKIGENYLKKIGDKAFAAMLMLARNAYYEHEIQGFGLIDLVPYTNYYNKIMDEELVSGRNEFDLMHENEGSSETRDDAISSGEYKRARDEYKRTRDELNYRDRSLKSNLELKKLRLKRYRAYANWLLPQEHITIIKRREIQEDMDIARKKALEALALMEKEMEIKREYDQKTTEVQRLKDQLYILQEKYEIEKISNGPDAYKLSMKIGELKQIIAFEIELEELRKAAKNL